MKNTLIIFILFYTSLQTVMAADVSTSKENSETNSSEKIIIPVFYKDYSWDIGIVGGMSFDGVQTDEKRTTIGTGVRGHYHLTKYVGLGVEYIGFFKSFESDNVVEETSSQMFLGSVTFDFSADRPYSLYAIASLGYERLNKEITGPQDNPVLLAGFGFRYMFADSWSANVEGRMKARLRDMSSSTGDYGLVGTAGINYHFGLSEEKSKLLEDAEKHSLPLEANK